MRQCGDCQLCCKLLPVVPLRKGAGEKCKHQKFGKGCTVYQTRAMPPECGLWNCRWLVGDDTADMPRPDRAHYVIDVVPDFVTIRDNETGARENVQVVQVWIDPKYPDEIYTSQPLRAYMERRAKQGIATICRFDSKRSTVVFPPQLAEDGQWHYRENGTPGPTHTIDQVVAALS